MKEHARAAGGGGDGLNWFGTGDGDYRYGDCEGDGNGANERGDGIYDAPEWQYEDCA